MGRPTQHIFVRKKSPHIRIHRTPPPPDSGGDMLAGIVAVVVIVIVLAWLFS